MIQESCCTCARLLAQIGSDGSGSEPPSYSASTAGIDPPFESRRRILSSSERAKEDEVFSEKSGAYDWEKKEDMIWEEKEGSSRGEDRRLSCCGRIICGECMERNERFKIYCPFCQVRNGDTTNGDTISDSTGRKPATKDKPPSYEETIGSHSSHSQTSLPVYSHSLFFKSQQQSVTQSQKESQSQSQPDDILHFLSHSSDSMTSLSLRYGVPIEVLRKKNGITSDYLLLARKTILIPGEWYKGGASLSPRPVEGEEEERRKASVRRFMVGCKVYEYDVAVLYLEQANYDLELAMGVYRDDERWEKENPISDKGKGKGKTKYDVGRRRFTGQR
ncbi:b9affb8a-b27f-4cf5-84d0-c8afb41b67c0 [Sclerotinia trifoliorum]|uniref:B9affb8a-b27f-4cf5-84d0-c8afb41b67c0 n=1 Tax=Sclerotinia trifoliorum TaxID=28548 RepID=A0A8H2ZL81_9HELO|nr:b9affb8a-b27f-4cf5-84d0-c8afb41b67c0 [Sclerotinia trifoliorum]